MVTLVKKQREVLKALEKSNPFSMDEVVRLSRVGSEDAVANILLELFDLDVIGGISRDYRGKVVSVTLSTLGKNYKELHAMVRCERWKERGIGFVAGVLASSVSALILHFTVGIG